jgi:hypothetical protein
MNSNRHNSNYIVVDVVEVYNSVQSLPPFEFIRKHYEFLKIYH